MNFFPILAIKLTQITTPVLALILLGMIGYEVINIIRAKMAAKVITDDEFKEGMHKAQVIDVREKDAFKAGHIMGARNLPYSTLKQVSASLRKDQPIYVYDQRKAMSKRAVILLKKQGFTDLYILKGGYENWTGKVKGK